MDYGFSAIMPEIVLVFAAMTLLMFGVFSTGRRTSTIVFNASVVVMVLVSLWLMMSSSVGRSAFNGAISDDGFARFSKVLILLSSSVVLLISKKYLQRAGIYTMELAVLVLLAVTGMMVMVSASDIMALYVGLELQSLALYVVAAYRRDSLRSSEAGLKYFVLGALSSGLFLFGASFVYGFTGATGYAEISAAISDDMPLGFIFGIAFMATAMAFKISAAPFHMWTPDVYQGAPTPITAFFAAAPKVAAAGMFARLMMEGFAEAVTEWQQIVAFLSVASMFVGAFGAIGQTNIKRMMAYSSIANMGYLLLALAAGTATGLSAMLIYLAIYVTMTVGAFAIIIFMERDGREFCDIASLSNLSAREPFVAFSLAVLMLSMAGIPPLAGFISKYLVIAAAIDAGLIWLGWAAVVASLIGAYYYLRIVFLVYFGQETGNLEIQMPFAARIVLGVSVALMFVWIANLVLIGDAAEFAAQSFFG